MERRRFTIVVSIPDDVFTKEPRMSGYVWTEVKNQVQMALNATDPDRLWTVESVKETL
jgi:hypothetical protein